MNTPYAVHLKICLKVENAEFFLTKFHDFQIYLSTRGTSTGG